MLASALWCWLGCRDHDVGSDGHLNADVARAGYAPGHRDHVSLCEVPHPIHDCTEPVEQQHRVT